MPKALTEEEIQLMRGRVSSEVLRTIDRQLKLPKWNDVSGKFLYGDEAKSLREDDGTAARLRACYKLVL